MDKGVSIIIPALNEAANLPHVLPRIPQLPEIEEVILVDGASRDGTTEVAQRLLPRIKVVRQDGRGKGNAILCGARAAIGDYFLVLDADGSHTPEEIPLYIEKAREGYDMVKGCRYLKGAGTEDETFDRAIMVRLTDFVANTLWRTNFIELAYGMFLIHRRKFLSLDIRASYLDVEWEVLIKAKRKGLAIARVAACEAARIYGKSHLTYRHDGWLIFKTVVREWLRGLLSLTRKSKNPA